MLIYCMLQESSESLNALSSPSCKYVLTFSLGLLNLNCFVCPVWSNRVLDDVYRIKYDKITILVWYAHL